MKSPFLHATPASQRPLAALDAAPAAWEGWVHDPDDASDSPWATSDAPQEVTFVDMDTFWATF